MTIEERGTGQGSVISPLIANIYLHYVFDRSGQPLATAGSHGRHESSCDLPMTSSAVSNMRMTPVASWRPCVNGCGNSRCRFHPGQDPPHRIRPPCGVEPTTARSEQAGNLQVPRLRVHLWEIPTGPLSRDEKVPTGPHGRELREIKEGLRQQLHQPIPETGSWLAQVVAGYLAYHAVPTNSRAIGTFRHHVVVLWHRGQRLPSTASWGHAAGFASRPDCLAASFNMPLPSRSGDGRCGRADPGWRRRWSDCGTFAAKGDQQ